jgi:deazaflavin-dependent oxidoreductase (nitroreductase family)
MAETQLPAATMPAFAKLMMRFQAFMLRRNMLGAMGNFVMVITVKGRKTGKAYSTPIAYMRDGDALIALTNQNPSNWYRNTLANSQITLNIKGQDISAHGSPITDTAEIERIFQLYLAMSPEAFSRMFGGISANAPQAELHKARDGRKYMRFTPIKK